MLAGLYARAGALRHERVVYYGFEEPRPILLRNFKQIGYRTGETLVDASDGTLVGPLTDAGSRERMLAALQEARADGGTVVVGGEAVDVDGAPVADLPVRLLPYDRDEVLEAMEMAIQKAMATPMSRIASVAPKPINIETRPPRAARVNRSRPNWSVPSRRSPGAWLTPSSPMAPKARTSPPSPRTAAARCRRSSTATARCSSSPPRMTQRRRARKSIG